MVYFVNVTGKAVIELCCVNSSGEVVVLKRYKNHGDAMASARAFNDGGESAVCSGTIAGQRTGAGKGGGKGNRKGYFAF